MAISCHILEVRNGVNYTQKEYKKRGAKTAKKPGGEKSRISIKRKHARTVQRRRGLTRHRTASILSRKLGLAGQAANRPERVGYAAANLPLVFVDWRA